MTVTACVVPGREGLPSRQSPPVQVDPSGSKEQWALSRVFPGRHVFAVVHQVSRRANGVPYLDCPGDRNVGSSRRSRRLRWLRFGFATRIHPRIRGVISMALFCHFLCVVFKSLSISASRTGESRCIPPKRMRC